MTIEILPDIRRAAAVSLAAAIVFGLFVSALTLAPASAEEHENQWEIWALDQGEGINRIHVYDSNLEETAVIAFGELDAPHDAVQTPHMIDFDETNRYAVVASTASGTVSIIRTADYAVLETIETGATAHMASFAPGNDAIWVANIGAQTFTEVSVDLVNEEFEIVGDIALASDLHAEDWDGWKDKFGEDLSDWPGPVCHEYTADGDYAYVTMGPADGGLVVVDLQEREIATAFDPREVRANCGLALSEEHGKMFANWSGTLEQDEDGEVDPGEWYVFDVSDHSLAAAFSADEGTDTLGVDPHGVRITPNGEELWQVNRGSQDGIVIDPETNEVIDDLELIDTPDILDFSPDGSYAFVTLRGPNPVSGAAHVATGGTPGVEVLDVENREHVTVLQPAGEDEIDLSDFHGIGVRGAIETDDQPADLAPATGSDGSQILFFMVLLGGLAGSALGTALLVRRRAEQYKHR